MCTKEEVRHVVKEEIESLEYRLREDVLNHVSKRIEELGKHLSPSQETITRLCAIEDWRKKHEELAIETSRKQDKMFFAMFGDSDTKDIGMLAKTDLIYTKMIGFNGVKGFFQWVLLTGGVITLLFTAFKKF
jgi:hypothetical protein